MSDLVTAWALVAAGLAALAFVMLMSIYSSRSPNQPWAALDKEEARVWLWAMLLSLLWPVAIPVWLVVQFFRIIRWAWSE